MLRNYLKITIAVLMRRKFLTFVNLFGAVLTLTVLVVAFAMLESVVSPAGAQHRQREFLTIFNAGIQRTGGGVLVGGPGYRIYEDYVATLETPDKTSFTLAPVETSAYLDGREISSQLRRTDAAYWDILDFKLIEGRWLAADDIDRGRFVAVINEATAEIWFPGEPALGKTVVANAESYEVVGVVANEPATSLLAFADIWVPLTTSQSYRSEWISGSQIMLYVEDPSRRAAVKQELQQALAGFVYTDAPAAVQRAAAAAWTPLEYLANAAWPARGGFDVALDRHVKDLVPEFISISIAVGLLFMSLPAINMTNLNIGRILERAPEIGLRKSAGASRRVLAGQFVFENVMLSALGGLIALAIAPLLLALLNGTLFTYGRLGLNWSVFAAAFVFVLVFGVLSGAYPAWKMAKLEPAVALRGSRHA